VMKRVDGRTLGEHIREHRDLGERLRIFERICEAVAFAHAQGVLHRDLTPGNVMVGAFGEVLVLDWGVAKVLDQRESVCINPPHSAPSKTMDGTVIGTRDYMSPEQARGEIDQIDERADVYSLGAVLKFLLTAKAAKAAKAICSKAMSHAPDSRYATAAELSADIGRLLDAEPVLAYRENVFEKLSRWAGKNRFLVLLILAYLLMRIFLIFTSRP